MRQLKILKTKCEENHMAREALWFEEVIYEKCQQLVKKHHSACKVQYSNFDLCYVVQLRCTRRA